MNYYEHHIGDFAEATAHLSFVEDAAYSRMIRKYYATERPLPTDLRAIERLILARTEEERAAVKIILEEFFELAPDGWHNARCDEELGRFHDKQAKAKRSADARWSAQRSHTERIANALPSQSERIADASGEDANASNLDAVGMLSSLQSPVTSKSKNGAEAPSKLVTAGDGNGGEPSSPKVSRGSRIPEDFTLTPSRARFATDSGVDPERTFAKFRDYWLALPGAKGTKLDWDSTWRNWVRTEAERNPRAKGGADNGLPYAN